VQLDDLRIDHRAVSAAEAAAIYTADAMPSQAAPPATQLAGKSPPGKEAMDEPEPSNARSSAEFFGIKIK
jgi:hypothetical protein